MKAAFVLIPSPFLGPGSWANVASCLSVAIVADYTAMLGRSGDFYRAVAETIAAQVAGRDCILVGHSGAGAMLPLVAEAIGRSVRCAVFADALLPHPGRSWFDTSRPISRRGSGDPRKTAACRDGIVGGRTVCCRHFCPMR
jgi:hypothetical protein